MTQKGVHLLFGRFFIGGFRLGTRAGGCIPFTGWVSSRRTGIGVFTLFFPWFQSFRWRGLETLNYGIGLIPSQLIYLFPQFVDFVAHLIHEFIVYDLIFIR